MLSVLCVKIVRLLPAAKLLFPVNALNAPPFALPETFDVGMLWPAPSVNAAVVLLVNAYRVIVSGGTETSHEVVIVMLDSPEPTPLRGRVTLTVEGVAEMVSVWPEAHFPTKHKSATTQLREILLPQIRAITTLEKSCSEADVPQFVVLVVTILGSYLVDVYRSGSNMIQLV
jgi:hypothetical protein